MNVRAIIIAVPLITAGTLSVRVAQELGAGPLVLFLLGCLLLWLAVLFFQNRRYGISTFSLVVAGALLFLVTVDRIDKLFVCKDCLARISTTDYFILGFIQSAEKMVDNNFAALVAADLGFPCSHKSLEYIRQHDYYGTLVCRQSGTGGMIGLWEDLTWYDSERSKVVSAFGKKHPEIGRRFWQSLVNYDDLDFRSEVIGAVVDNNLTDDVAAALNAVPTE